MKQTIKFLALCGLGSAFFFVVIMIWAYTPVVYQSYSTKACVEVVSPDPKHNCENMPTRYEHVWVE